MGKSNLPVEQHDVKWKDRKRIIFGLPWSFTRYRLTDDKLIVSTGLFSINEEEIRLYRIMDVTLKRSLGERLWGLGTIHICSSDDGINAAGGNDVSGSNNPGMMGPGGRPGRPGDNFGSTSNKGKILISGGMISIMAKGDGIDANGNLIAHAKGAIDADTLQKGIDMIYVTKAN